MLKKTIHSWDARRDLMIAGTLEEAIAFTAEHWIHTAQRSIQQKGRFAVALSGGSTPKPIYQLLATKYKEAIDWNLVHLFWSDERSVPPEHPDSNYSSAMHPLKALPIPASQIHRIKGENHPDKGASDYQELIERLLGNTLFDLVMLGVGEDGHTASLFPHSPLLTEEKKLVASAPVPFKGTRISLTFPCINRSAHTLIHAFGPSKQAIVPLVLNAAIQSPFPASKVGTPEHKALWIVDNDAAHLLS